MGHAPASEDMRSRLHRLEALIGSMAQTSPKPAMHTPESSSDGRMTDDHEDENDRSGLPDLDTRSASLVGQRFVAAGNWEAVLQDVCGDYGYRLSVG